MDTTLTQFIEKLRQQLIKIQEAVTAGKVTTTEVENLRITYPPRIHTLFQTLDLTIDHMLPFELEIDNLLLEIEGLNEILEGIVQQEN
ncbi:7421_t:CDS:2 [Dentiscutata heterogama]|uniref:7421_t:CDS:1 n=1 Tax=Dentiscutata heterogama TaxID=1316150 RepID=A0ACA9MPC4_9GLOM|nr:7421_t:CDS:2 [Dentiscutata heterogama]